MCQNRDIQCTCICNAFLAKTDPFVWLFLEIRVICAVIPIYRIHVYWLLYISNYISSFSTISITSLDFSAREFHITPVLSSGGHEAACHRGSVVFRAPSVKLKRSWQRVLTQQVMSVKYSSLKKVGQDVCLFLSVCVSMCVCVCSVCFFVCYILDLYVCICVVYLCKTYLCVKC